MNNDDLKSHLYALEEELASCSIRCDQQRMDTLLTDDFREFGASGRRFTKQETIDLVSKEDDFTPYELLDFALTRLGEGHALVTYTIPARKGPDGTPKPGSRRSSVWREGASGWQLVFHQGTRTQ